MLVLAGRAAPLLPRATSRVPIPPLCRPCPYNDSEPLARPRRRHSRGGDPCGHPGGGTYALASLENVSGRENDTGRAVGNYGLSAGRRNASRVFTSTAYSAGVLCSTIV